MSLRAGVARCRQPLLLAAAGVIAILIAGLAATPAAAHASLVSSSPPDGAAVATAPVRIELIFSEDLAAPSIIAVRGPDGIQVADGPTQIRHMSAIQPINTLTTAGVYKIAYRVVSADGHPVSGQLTFTYAPPGSDVLASDRGGSTPAEGAADGHSAHFVALGILVLAAVVAAVIAFRKDRRYEQVRTERTHTSAREAGTGEASTAAPDHTAPDTAAPDSTPPDPTGTETVAAETVTAGATATDAPPGDGAKKQRAR